jgi:hypothetical protein
MHDATFMPEVADRKLREQWEQEGASTVHQRAMNKALEILSTPNSAALDPAVDARIRAAFARRGRGRADPPEARQPAAKDRLNRLDSAPQVFETMASGGRRIQVRQVRFVTLNRT